MSIDSDIQAYQKELIKKQKRLYKLLFMSKNISMQLTNELGEVTEFDKVKFAEQGIKKRRTSLDVIKDGFALSYVAGENKRKKATSVIKFYSVLDDNESIYQGFTVLGGLDLKDYSGVGNDFIMHKAIITELKKEDDNCVYSIKGESVQSGNECNSEVKIWVHEKPKKRGEYDAESKEFLKAVSEERMGKISAFFHELVESAKAGKRTSVEIWNERVAEKTILDDVSVVETSISDKWKDIEITLQDKKSSDSMKLSIPVGSWMGGVRVRFSRPLPRAVILCHWSDYNKSEENHKTVFNITNHPFEIKITVE